VSPNTGSRAPRPSHTLLCLRTVPGNPERLLGWWCPMGGTDNPDWTPRESIGVGADARRRYSNSAIPSGPLLRTVPGPPAHPLYGPLVTPWNSALALPLHRRPRGSRVLRCLRPSSSFQERASFLPMIRSTPPSRLSLAAAPSHSWHPGNPGARAGRPGPRPCPVRPGPLPPTRLRIALARLARVRRPLRPCVGEMAVSRPLRVAVVRRYQPHRPTSAPSNCTLIPVTER